MNIKQWMIPVTVMMVSVIAGCSGNNRAGLNNGYNDNARPIGYYSNENHPNQSSALFNDNDGPLVEMMDHTLGAESKITRNQKSQLLNNRDEFGNPPNPTKPLATNDRNFFQHDNRFSTSDVNYSRHLNEKSSGYYTDSKTLHNASDKIKNVVAKVNNVSDVRSVVYGHSIVISVQLNDKTKAEKTKKTIRKAVLPYANGRSITVITDEGTISRDRIINNDLIDGGAR